MTSNAPTRRKVRIALPLPKTVTGRRRLTTVLVLLASGLAGYLVTCVAYPRPVFQQDHAVARVIGMPAAEAEKLLTSQGFKPKIEGEESNPDLAAGSVIWQDPPPDLIAPKGTAVLLVKSSGPAAVPVPDVTDFDVQAATKILVAAGLKVGDVDSVPNGAEPGIVVATRPDPGAAGLPGAAVTLLVSRGPSTLAAPNVVGLKLDEARRQLEQAGFRLGRISKVDRRGPPGTVVEQSPAAGARAMRGSRIDLVVTEIS